MGEQVFKLKAPYAPTGDQPEAIAKLTAGVKNGFASRRCWA